MSYRIHIDSFETGFSDLKKKQYGDEALILSIARRERRFSAFEMNQPIFNTLKRLEAAGHFKIDKDSVGYPWTLLVFPDDKVSP